MSKQLVEITGEELLERLGEKHVQVIDIRPVEAYNGWRLRKESRGGHIASARSLPFQWTRYMDWIEIVRSKGILPAQQLVIYGYDAGQTTDVVSLFQRAGFNRVKVYPGFQDEWTQDEGFPMKRLARYRHLVSAEWVAGLLRGEKMDERGSGGHVVCHAHYRNPDAYHRGHIPGAVELDTNRLESDKTWNRRPAEEIRQTLESLGIDKDTTVILYGTFMAPENDDPFPGSSAGQLGAMRCAAIMLWAGVSDVRILNGGFQSWLDAGLPVSRENVRSQPVDSFGIGIPAQPGIMVDIDTARRMLADTEANLVSVRSWPEYTGEVSGYNYIEKKGRIPGSVFGNCGSDAYHMENYRNLDHTTREYGEIETMWAEAGITPDKHNAFYCGTGWRGSEAFVNAWLMGWPRVSVYDGGWFEWSADEKNPVESGIPQGFDESGRFLE